MKSVDGALACSTYNLLSFVRETCSGDKAFASTRQRVVRHFARFSLAARVFTIPNAKEEESRQNSCGDRAVSGVEGFVAHVRESYAKDC